jgi:hypothetical protein
MSAHTHTAETAELAVPPSGSTPDGGYVYVYRLRCTCGAERLVRAPDSAMGDESPAWLAEHGQPVQIAGGGR